MDQQRKLTPAEQKRKADFEKIREEMKERGYAQRDLTVSVLRANVMAVVVMLPFVIACVAVYRFVNLKSIFVPSLTDAFAPLFIAFLQCVLHEAVHGLTWGLFAKSHLRAIRFGFIWNMLTPYCTCAEPLTRGQYILGSAMPTLILGFGQAALATVLGSAWLMAISAIMLFGGGGDFYIILKMLTYRPKGNDVMYYDHPYECGLVAFEK